MQILFHFLQSEQSFTMNENRGETSKLTCLEPVRGLILWILPEMLDLDWKHSNPNVIRRMDRSTNWRIRRYFHSYSWLDMGSHAVVTLTFKKIWKLFCNSSWHIWPFRFLQLTRNELKSRQKSKVYLTEFEAFIVHYHLVQISLKRCNETNFSSS